MTNKIVYSGPFIDDVCTERGEGEFDESVIEMSLCREEVRTEGVKKSRK